MLIKLLRHLLWRQRVKAALAWRDAERAQWEADREAREAREQPSIMRQLLAPDEAARLEIGPGRWLLPGPPP